MFVLNILVVLICTTGFLGAKKIYCDLDDVKCTTQSAARDFHNEIAGKEGLWESSDPLKSNLVESCSSDLSIKSYNGALIGLSQCDRTILKMDTKAQTMKFDIVCPRLTTVGDYVIMGYIGDVYVDGIGDCSATRDHHKLIFNTKYENYFKNGKQYINITAYDIGFECGDKVSYKCEIKVFKGEQKKADAAVDHANRNWKTMEEIFGNQLMRNFMSEYIKNINDEFKVIPIKELFYYEV